MNWFTDLTLLLAKSSIFWPSCYTELGDVAASIWRAHISISCKIVLTSDRVFFVCHNSSCQIMPVGDVEDAKVQVKSSGTVLPYVGVACLGAVLFGYHLGYALYKPLSLFGKWFFQLLYPCI